jgi:hypothetical protein
MMAAPERSHRSLAGRFVAVNCALPSEMELPEVCDLENHKCDTGDDQECRQCNHFMTCIKHRIAPDCSAWRREALLRRPALRLAS